MSIRRGSLRLGAKSWSSRNAQRRFFAGCKPLARGTAPDPRCRAVRIVLFGATGDLAHRKLVPALFQLARAGNLPSECAIVGFARRDWTDDDLRAEYEKIAEQERRRRLSARSGRSSPAASSSRQGTFDDLASYQKLKQTLERVDRTLGTHGNRVYYLAVAPEFFATIIQQAGRGRSDLSRAAGTAPGAASSSRSRSATTSKAPAR